MNGSRVMGRRALWVGLAIAACAAPAVSLGAEGQSFPESWSKPTTPFRIIDNVYYVGTEGLGAYLIATSKGHFVLDGALAESASLIEANITALGFKLADVKYLLNSHAHFDHSGGLAQLKKDTGAQLIASEGDRSALEGGFYLGSETVKAFSAPPVKVDRAVADGEAIELGGVRLIANLTPGHTRGCTSWSMQVQEAGKPVKVLFFCSSSVAANRLVDPPQYPGIVADYEKTFARAKSMRVDVFLAGHPEFFDLHGKRARQKEGTPNPFIAPTEFGAFIERSEADFQKQLAAQRAASAQKK